jgi:SAM-dependent methyltransferase
MDVVELRHFYASHLGAVARRILAHRIRARWRRVHGLTLFGIGYASPYLGAFQGEVRVLGALMPAAQGAVIWPSSGPIRTAMVDEERLPLPDNSVDRLLVVHCLEAAGSHAPALLREMWRVLTPEGRLLLVVPNRRGVWARRDATPFGSGQPYSRGQLERLLQDAMFTPLDWSTALHVPPIDKQFIVRWATVFERLGTRFWPLFAGVVLVEARKELIAPVGRAEAARAAKPLIAKPVIAAQPARSNHDQSVSSTVVDCPARISKDRS